MGWIIYRHGVLYHQEYGWDDRFESLVADVVADYLRSHDPARERCWIAERDGDNVGCVFMIAHPTDSSVVQLRLLLVEPSARGLGLGRDLVQQCTEFAREVGYKKISLWTNSVLHTARAIYQAEGYELVDEQPHAKFGKGLVGQTWEKEV